VGFFGINFFCATHARIDPGFILIFSLTGHGTGPFFTTHDMNLPSLEGRAAFSFENILVLLKFLLFYTSQVFFKLGTRQTCLHVFYFLVTAGHIVLLSNFLKTIL